jgi:hypothetical protein
VCVCAPELAAAEIIHLKISSNGLNSLFSSFSTRFFCISLYAVTFFALIFNQSTATGSNSNELLECIDVLSMSK